LISTCEKYSSATGGLRCIFDTSRNFNGSPNKEWCNARSAGIGAPPTSDTGLALVDYFLWLKVPGESDGECTGQSSDAMIGPSAGQFFAQAFTKMWDQGYFVQKQGMPKIGDQTPCPSTEQPAIAPTTATPTVVSLPQTTSSPPTTAPISALSTSVSLEPIVDSPKPTEMSTGAPSSTSTPTSTLCSTEEPILASPEHGSGSLTFIDGSSSTIAHSPTPVEITKEAATTSPTNSNEAQAHQTSSTSSGTSDGITILSSLVGVGVVVAVAVAAVVVRKRLNKDKDYIERDLSSVVILTTDRERRTIAVL